MVRSSRTCPPNLSVRAMTQRELRATQRKSEPDPKDSPQIERLRLELPDSEGVVFVAVITSDEQ